MAASFAVGAWRLRDITSGYLWRAEVFDFGEAHGQKFLTQIIRFKISYPGFADGFDASGAAVVVGALFRREGMRRIAVIEDDVRAVGQFSDEGESGPDGDFGEVGNDTKPGEKGLLGGIEAGGGEAFGQSLTFEVDGGEGEPGRKLDCGFEEALALPGLRGRMVDFENVQARGAGAAIGVGVEASAENDELEDALVDGCGQGVFSEARACGDEKAHAEP